MTNDDAARDPAVERARKRVKELKDFYSHLIIYLVVNAGLVIIDLIQGDGLQWAYWVMIGWGIGLVAHAVSVFILDTRLGAGWEAKKVDQYTEQERRYGQPL